MTEGRPLLQGMVGQLPISAVRSPGAGARGTLTRSSTRLWHWLLTPGWLRQTSASRVRGWARLLDWREATTLRSRARLVKQALGRPMRAWQATAPHAARHGARVEAEVGLQPHAQRRRMWWLMVRHGITPQTYYGFLLYRPERWPRAADYVQETEYFRVMRWYNRQHPEGDAATMIDKPRFAEWCRTHGVPTVPTLLEFDTGQLVMSALGHDPAGALPRSDLFSKPSEGTGGYGAVRWRFDGSGAWNGDDGCPRSASDLLAHLAEMSRTLPQRNSRSPRRIMLQPCLGNHRELRSLTTGALCTVRVVTLRAPGRRAQAIGAMYRMAVGGASADNFSVGGVAAPVDLATGELRSAIRRTAHGIVAVERHPDTSAVIAGTRLPHWPEILELCERGLELANVLPSIGWDVAITDNGPIVIEGNPASHPGVLQRATGVPLEDTPLPAALDAYMRRLFDI
jgi:hypothetical protein